ncbi:MAG: DUF3311 domain-containing protein [Negativicutes bacterium]|nr:DUF3311 domain-containing protein [Negativicutes bacterium]
MHRPTIEAILIGFIPFIAMCFSISFWDQVHPFVLGLPFNIFWIIAWIVITPLFMSVAYRIEVARIAKDKGEQGGDAQ